MRPSRGERQLRDKSDSRVERQDDANGRRFEAIAEREGHECGRAQEEDHDTGELIGEDTRGRDRLAGSQPIRTDVSEALRGLRVAQPGAA